MDDSLHFLQSMYCCSHLPLNFFLQVKNLSIVSVAKIFVPSFDLDITNKDWSQPLPTISININIEQNCQQSRICCQPCFQFWTCEYLKSLMLIAVYSCNPFEDYHRITIHYNISHKMFLERERLSQCSLCRLELQTIHQFSQSRRRPLLGCPNFTSTFCACLFSITF